MLDVGMRASWKTEERAVLEFIRSARAFSRASDKSSHATRAYIHQAHLVGIMIGLQRTQPPAFQRCT